MKLLKLNNNIINLEAIRNIGIKFDRNVEIHFLNPANENDHVTIYCRSKKEAAEIVNEIYEIMEKKD